MVAIGEGSSSNGGYLGASPCQNRPATPLLGRVSSSAICVSRPASRSRYHMIVEARTTTGLVAAIAVVAAAYFASSVFQPLAFALFIIALLWPLQSRLQSHMPQLLALAIVLLVTVIGFTVFASLVAWSFARVGRWLVNDAARYQLLYEQLAAWLESHGIVLASLWADYFNV